MRVRVRVYLYEFVQRRWNRCGAGLGGAGIPGAGLAARSSFASRCESVQVCVTTTAFVFVLAHEYVDILVTTLQALITQTDVNVFP